MNQSRRDFMRKSMALGVSSFLPFNKNFFRMNRKIRTAHIGVGGMGLNDLKAISSHKSVEVSALCDVDSKLLNPSATWGSKSDYDSEAKQLAEKFRNNIEKFNLSSEVVAAGPKV